MDSIQGTRGVGIQFVELSTQNLGGGITYWAREKETRQGEARCAMSGLAYSTTVVSEGVNSTVSADLYPKCCDLMFWYGDDV